jgi:hypothetical protein
MGASTTESGLQVGAGHKQVRPHLGAIYKWVRPQLGAGYKNLRPQLDAGYKWVRPQLGAVTCGCAHNWVRATSECVYNRIWLCIT